MKIMFVDNGGELDSTVALKPYPACRAARTRKSHATARNAEHNFAMAA